MTNRKGGQEELKMLPEMKKQQWNVDGNIWADRLEGHNSASSSLYPLCGQIDVVAPKSEEKVTEIDSSLGEILKN